jgi:excisionase family DNA binding protein
MSQEADRKPLRGEVMDVEGVAEYLGFSPSTIYEKVQGKDIPHVRIGNSLRFPKAVIDRWLEENTIQAMPSIYDRYLRMASAFFFQKWLESRGVDPAKLDDEQLPDLVSRASKDLQALNKGDLEQLEFPS